MHPKEDELEKRAHYRVEDELEFAYYPLPEGEAPESLNDSDVIEHLFDARGAKQYRLMRAMRQLDEQASDEFTHLMSTQPSVASYLKIINRKFELVLNELLLSEQTDKKKVNLSLGGVCFFSKEILPLKSCVKMKFVLKPSFDILLCQGHVQRVENLLVQSPHPLIKTSVSFHGLTDPDEKLLSRHIMYRQTEQLRGR